MIKLKNPKTATKRQLEQFAWQVGWHAAYAFVSAVESQARTAARGLSYVAQEYAGEAATAKLNCRITARDAQEAGCWPLVRDGMKEAARVVIGGNSRRAA